MPDREGVQPVKGGPSEAAVNVAAARCGRWTSHQRDPENGPFDGDERDYLWGLATAMLAGAHDPELGLDRSVRLGDVVEWLWAEARRPVHQAARLDHVIGALAVAIAREFGATTHAE